jgi:hypothetical protein
MTIKINELVFSPELGYDVNTVIAKLDYDPAAYKTKAAAAKALYKALVKLAKSWGQSEKEVFITSPEESSQGGFGNCWRVCWEAGPYEWAISASFQITGPWGYTEPYYSFDLCFTE